MHLLSQGQSMGPWKTPWPNAGPPISPSNPEKDAAIIAIVVFQEVSLPILQRLRTKQFRSLLFKAPSEMATMDHGDWISLLSGVGALEYQTTLRKSHWQKDDSKGTMTVNVATSTSRRMRKSFIHYTSKRMGMSYRL